MNSEERIRLEIEKAHLELYLIALNDKIAWLEASNSQTGILWEEDDEL